MNIEIKFKDPWGNSDIRIIVFGCGKTRKEITFENSTVISRKKTQKGFYTVMYDNVFVNGNDGSGHLDDLRWKEIMCVEVEDEYGTCAVNELAEITVIDGDNKYEIPETLFLRFICKEIPLKDKYLKMNGLEYNHLFEYFMKQNLINNFINAVANNYDLNFEYEQILTNKEIVEELAEEFENQIFEMISREDEVCAIEKCMEKVHRYQLVSNKKELTEIVQHAYLTNKQVEHIQNCMSKNKEYEFCNEDGELMSTKYISIITACPTKDFEY